MGNVSSDYGSGQRDEMQPSRLKFTHDSISVTFQDGYTLDETLLAVLNGDIAVQRIPPLVVMQYQREWYVVRGNRRLYLYQLLENHGKLYRVPVLKKNFDSFVFHKQYTSTNGGRSVRLRGDHFMKQKLDKIISQHSGTSFIIISVFKCIESNNVQPKGYREVCW